MTDTKCLAIAMFAAVGVLACGGGGKKATTTVAEPQPTTDAEQPPESSDPVAAPEPAPPPPPKVWNASVTMTAVKGAKLAPPRVSLTQTEGAETMVKVEGLETAKPGTYWLVVHEHKECGPNATKVGAELAGGDANMKIVITKGMSELEPMQSNLALGGDDAISGHAVVLHEDKKGKPGKALACGVVETAEDEG